MRADLRGIMRMKSTLGLLYVGASAALAASCGGQGGDGAGGSDPMAELCKHEAYKSLPACKGALQVRINTCPEIDLSLSPARIAPGSQTVLSALLYDDEHDEVAQEWLADPDGRFDASAPAEVHYYCESIGRKLITLIATDAQGCESMQQTEVLCVDASSFENAGADPIGY
jgi:hypothetical protein